MEKVRKELDALKKQFVEAPEVDDTNAPVSNLIEDIDLVLENPGELSFEHHRQIVHKLENALLLFEAGHENLMKQIQAVINSLNEVGI